MKPFKEEYLAYAKACYGGKILNPVQEKEVKQAFYSGAFIGLNVLIDALEKGATEQELQEATFQLYREIATVLAPGGGMSNTEATERS